MSEAVLSIGSNLGDRIEQLRSALDGLAPWLCAVSPVYETAPWGPVPQQDFLNAVLVVADPDATPRSWLARARACEQAAGRRREQRWGPRSLDVDVLQVLVDGHEVVDADPELTLPHPRIAERAFVLVPWLALRPEGKLRGVPLRDLLDRLPAADRLGVRRCDVTLIATAS